MTLAFSSKHPHVQQNRWIASLSDGSTVFEDKTPGLKSAWIRLSDYLRSNNLAITNLRLECYGQRITLIPAREGIDGYWQSSKICSMLNGPVVEFYWRGVGYIKDGMIHITWVGQDGSITQETRAAENDAGNIFAK